MVYIFSTGNAGCSSRYSSMYCQPVISGYLLRVYIYTCLSLCPSSLRDPESPGIWCWGGVSIIVLD